MQTTATTNARAARCIYCAAPIAPHEGHAAPIASDGGRSRYICDHCHAAANDLPMRATIERATVGTATSSGLTWGYLLLVERPTTAQRGELAKAGYISKATVDPAIVEFVSQWKRSRCGSKQWRTLEALNTRGLITIECKTQSDPEALSEWINANTRKHAGVSKEGALQLVADIESGAEAINRAAEFIAKTATLFEKLQARPEWSERYRRKLRAAELEAFPWEEEGGEDYASAVGMDA